MNEQQRDELVQTWRLKEFVFEGVFGRFRAFWYEIAAKWALRHLLNQQNEVNQMVRQGLLDQAEWLTRQDREQVELRQQVAELRIQLIQAQKRIAVLEERLDE